MITKRFKVALSFPGEQRRNIKKIARELRERWSKKDVLYDFFHRAEFARPDLASYLPELYKNESELLVVFLCEDYQNKKWCRLEWDAIKNIINNFGSDRIMYFWCGDGRAVALPEIGFSPEKDGYIPFYENSMKQNAKYIIERYTQLIDKKVQEDMLQCLANPELRNIKKLRYRKLERIK